MAAGDRSRVDQARRSRLARAALAAQYRRLGDRPKHAHRHPSQLAPRTSAGRVGRSSADAGNGGDLTAGRSICRRRSSPRGLREHSKGRMLACSISQLRTGSSSRSPAARKPACSRPSGRCSRRVCGQAEESKITRGSASKVAASASIASSGAEGRSSGPNPSHRRHRQTRVPQHVRGELHACILAQAAADIIGGALRQPSATRPTNSARSTSTASCLRSGSHSARTSGFAIAACTSATRARRSPRASCSPGMRRRHRTTPSRRARGGSPNQPGVQPCEHRYRGDTRGLARRLERLFRALAWWRVSAAHPVTDAEW